MWQKYQIGTDHLFDYLEKRLALYGEDNIEFPEVELPPEVIEWTEGSRRQPRNNANQNYQQLLSHSIPQEAPQSPQGRHSPSPSPSPSSQGRVSPSTQRQDNNNGNNIYNNYTPQQQQFTQHQQQLHQARRPPAQPVDVQTDLTTKTVVLKNWAISAIRGDLKPKMVKLGNFVSRTMDVRSVSQVTSFTEKMKPEVDKARAYLPMPPPAPRPAPTLLPGGDKLIPLRYAASIVVDDINFMLGAFFGMLQQTSDVNLILGIVGFLKEITRELSYLAIAYQ
jgi:hypothetical protein